MTPIQKKNTRLTRGILVGDKDAPCRCKLKIGLIALLFLLLSNQADASTIGRPTNFLALNTGLVGWWTFDGPDMVSNVVDRSIKSNHGFLIGQRATTTIPGKIGQALSFDGVNDYVYRAHASVTSLNFDHTTPFSISIWVKPNNVTHSGYWINKRTAVTDFAGWITFQAAAKTELQIRRNSSERLISDSTNNVLVAGKWQHLVFTYDGSNDADGMKTYVDGVSVAVTSTVNLPITASITNTANLMIGARNDVSFPYDGAIDDIRIYNRELSSSEAKRLYNMSAASKVSASVGLTTGLVGHWTFDGPDMLSNVSDKSGQGNTGYFIHGGSGTTTVLGKVGQALTFDGSNDYVRIPDSDSLSFGNGTVDRPFSISAWAYYVDTRDGGYFPIFGKYTDTAPIDGEYTLFIGEASSFGTAGSDQLLIQVNDDSATVRLRAESTTAVPRNQWVHLAMTYTGSSADTGFELYMNGEEMSVDRNTQGSYVAMDNETGYATIGALINSPTETFDEYGLGKVDDVRLYNRVLSAAEVRQLYSTGGATKLSSSQFGRSGCSSGISCGLVGHWTFDGPDMLTNVRDRSSQVIHGSLLGQISTTSVPGKFGQALNFDGVDDYVDLGVASRSILPSAGTFSVSLWMKTSSSTRNVLFGNYDGTSDASIAVEINRGATLNDDKKMTLWLRPQITQTMHGYTTSDIATLNDNKWHHLVYIWIGATDTIKLYFDGAEQAVSYVSQVGEATLTTSFDQNFYIGALNNVGTPFAFAGASVDDIRIYNHTLSNDEVLQLYNLGR